MAEITAAAVKAFRERTGLPMMDCKRALVETGGDEDAALELLRKKGLAKMSEKSAERSTEEGVIAVAKSDGAVGMVELLCESAPVATSPDFLQLADDIAAVVASQPVFATVEELMAQPSPSKAPQTLQQQLEDLFNRIREVFRVKRYLKIEGNVAHYLHHDHKVGVVLVMEEGSDVLGRDICMHIAAMRPEGLSAEDLDPALLANERRIQLELMNEDPKDANKPEAIKEKIITGRMESFIAQKCLLSQPFVKEPGQTVAQYAASNGMKIVKFIHWILGK